MMSYFFKSKVLLLYISVFLFGQEYFELVKSKHTLLISSILPVDGNSKNQLNNVAFFEDATFTLAYYFVNGIREDYVLQTGEFAPRFSSNLNTTTNLLETEMGAYCNATSAVFEDKGSYFEVISRGGTTLSQCDNDDNRFFTIVTGNIYLQQPAQKVYYEITSDEKGLWMWVDENEKLFFDKSTLSIEKQKLESLIEVYPNPANRIVKIKSKGIFISEIKVIDISGKELLKKEKNFNEIDISSLSKGIYFLKIKSSKATLTKKIVVN